MSVEQQIGLRDATTADLDGIAAVVDAAWRDAYGEIVPPQVTAGLSPQFWRELLASVAPATRDVVATGGDGQIVGFTRFGRDPLDPAGGYVASLYVDPVAAGAGIGSRLLDHALSELQADGHGTVSLSVFRDNTAARALYERFGFVSDGSETVDPRWQAPQLRYRKRLDGGPAAAPEHGGVQVSSPTEERNPRTTDIDTLGSLELLQRLNAEDARVAGAVSALLPELARLVDLTVPRLRSGGRVHYFGAGTSGRIGVLDAVEWPPTFGVDPDLAIAHLAGGDVAGSRAQEGAEDDAAQGERDCAGVGREDVVLGLAASGYTPYVGGALRRAREIGALTALVTSNPSAPLAGHADVVLCAETGPEAITGSTRLKSATAQKLILNAFSTAIMVRSGRTWSNLMVDLMPTNAKLRGRLLRLLMQATGESETSCARALAAADQEPKTALLSLLSGASTELARAALQAHEGRVADALTELSVA